MSTFNNFLKITPAMAKAIGATTDQEFSDKFAAFLQTGADNAAAFAKLQTDFSALQTSAGETQAALVKANETISAQAGKISSLESKLGDPATLTEAKIKTLATDTAKTEASRVAVEQIGSIGGAPATAAPVNVNAPAAGTKSFTDLIAAEIATGKTKPDAVMAVIKANPEAHAKWLQSGGKL